MLTSPLPVTTVVSRAVVSRAGPLHRTAGMAASEKSPFTSWYVNFSSMLNGVRIKPSCIDAVALFARGNQNLP